MRFSSTALTFCLREILKTILCDITTSESAVHIAMMKQWQQGLFFIWVTAVDPTTDQNQQSHEPRVSLWAPQQKIHAHNGQKGSHQNWQKTLDPGVLGSYVKTNELGFWRLTDETRRDGLHRSGKRRKGNPCSLKRCWCKFLCLNAKPSWSEPV